MVKVYFQTDTHAELVATFTSEELYIRCLPVLNSIAKEQRMIVAENIMEG